MQVSGQASHEERRVHWRLEHCKFLNSSCYRPYLLGTRGCHVIWGLTDCQFTSFGTVKHRQRRSDGTDATDGLADSR